VDDALALAASFVDYATGHGKNGPVHRLGFEFKIARHPCDDEPYLADVKIVSWGWNPAQIDGSGAGDV